MNNVREGVSAQVEKGDSDSTTGVNSWQAHFSESGICRWGDLGHIPITFLGTWPDCWLDQEKDRAQQPTGTYFTTSLPSNRRDFVSPRD
jgi:hypothetical protein